MAEFISTLNLIFDSGTLILIWIVQLVVYPSFAFYKKDDLVHWHRAYKQRISFVVLPLMLGQLVFGFVSVYLQPDIHTLVRITIIVLLWIITFSIFVPLHSKIEEKQATESIVFKLISKNWSRTLLWTILFISNFVD